ncbi:nucleotidyltransferase family protein [Candidatus Clostridium stratigraminis]|uniref:NTP transferase domain-containing protein n=1 Tax=Candidatus Clostridium stratigraminis TaxID=3381661 RepID=A0ABW8T617_9CLOT
MFIRGIILGAGKSSRMGYNKLAIKIDDSTILQRVIENAKASKLNELVFITGKYDLDTDIKKLHNEEYEKGMSTSIKKGLESFNGDAVMILLGDMPFVSSGLINKLYDCFNKSNKSIIVPINEGMRGNPVIIGKKYFQDLLINEGDKGARDIINNNPEDVFQLEIQDRGIFIDIDDKSAVERFL